MRSRLQLRKKKQRICKIHGQVCFFIFPKKKEERYVYMCCLFCCFFLLFYGSHITLQHDMLLLELPCEILVEVLELAPKSALLACRPSCHVLREIIDSVASVWTLLGRECLDVKDCAGYPGVLQSPMLKCFTYIRKLQHLTNKIQLKLNFYFPYDDTA
jgi:hypothetical protein